MQVTPLTCVWRIQEALLQGRMHRKEWNCVIMLLECNSTASYTEQVFNQTLHIW